MREPGVDRCMHSSHAAPWGKRAGEDEAKPGESVQGPECQVQLLKGFQQGVVGLGRAFRKPMHRPGQQWAELRGRHCAGGR